MKAVKTLSKMTNLLIDTVFTAVLLLGCYFAYDSWYVYHHADLSQVRVRAAENPGADLPREYPENCVAWITVYDTGIDFPIMQGQDNTEYLNKDPFGNYSLAGSVFLDSRNDRDFGDAYSLIYGHHMSGRHMFGALDDFADEDFFDRHRKGEIVRDGVSYPLITVAYTECEASEEILFDPLTGKDVLSYVEKSARIFRKEGTGSLIALSTCRDTAGTGRTILFLRYDMNGGGAE